MTGESGPFNVAALQPGRLTPMPVAAVSVDPAVDAPAPSPSPRAAAAFNASSPAAQHARQQEQLRKRFWLGLSIADHGAATFDAWTTRRVISSGEGYEMDPLMRPFAGNASLYAAMQAGPLLFEYVGLCWHDEKSMPSRLGTTYLVGAANRGRGDEPGERGAQFRCSLEWGFSVPFISFNIPATWC